MSRVPKTTAGRWSVWLGVAFVVLMAISLLWAIAIGGDPARVVDNPFLPVLNLALNLAGLFSLVTGIFGIIKHREWSIALYLAGLYALAALLFLAGEFLFPH
jgi:hypothetical protein